MYCFNNFQLTTTSLYHFTCIKYKIKPYMNIEEKIYIVKKL
nr:MAG TPA: hypothetical protein [Caudoviricetes sp.]